MHYHLPLQSAVSFSFVKFTIYVPEEMLKIYPPETVEFPTIVHVSQSIFLF
jgi:hypothetical protein